MLDIKLYTFNKKKNSTKIPNPITDQSVSLAGEVKHDFSPVNPVITFNLSNPTEVPAYNYAYISAFGKRYYFITDWLFVGGLWRASMTVDVLASYRTAILNSRQFVARSKTLNPGGVIDAAYPALANTTLEQLSKTPTAFWGSYYYNGTIILGCVGASGQNVGANTYYAMSVKAFSYFMDAMLSSPNWLNISASEISQDLQKALINPTQYITSCIWLPLSWERVVYNSGAPLTDLNKTIRCGWWDFTLPTGEGTGEYIARRLYNPLTLNYDCVRINSSWTLPKHPQAASRGKWLNLAPYSKYTLAFPPFGVFELDTTDIVNATEINLSVTVHYYTGDAVLRVQVVDPNFPDQNKDILRVNTNIAVQIPVGQIAMNLANFDNAILAGAASGVSELATMASDALTNPQTTRSSPSPHSRTTHRR